MARVRQRDTVPEVLLRRLLWAVGLRYRVNYRVEGVRADIAFPKQHLAIFVDGCFWHACPLHGTKPKTNQGFWGAKLRDNCARDQRQTFRLQSAGWAVLRFWEHDAATGFDEATAEIHRILARLNK